MFWKNFFNIICAFLFAFGLLLISTGWLAYFGVISIIISLVLLLIGLAIFRNDKEVILPKDKTPRYPALELFAHIVFILVYAFIFISFLKAGQGGFSGVIEGYYFYSYLFLVLITLLLGTFSLIFRIKPIAEKILSFNQYLTLFIIFLTFLPLIISQISPSFFGEDMGYVMLFNMLFIPFIFYSQTRVLRNINPEKVIFKLSSELVNFLVLLSIGFSVIIAVFIAL